MIAVKNRDRHPLAQRRLDLETLRPLDILQVDAAERRLQRRHHVDEFLRILLIDLDIEDVDAGEFLEQDGLAFHHRFRCERPDIAETQDCCTVGNHAYEILPGCEFCRLHGVVDDRLAGRRNAGRIGQRQVALVAQRLGGLDLKLTGLRQLVVNQRARAQINRHFTWHLISRWRTPLFPDFWRGTKAGRISASWIPAFFRNCFKWRTPYTSRQLPGNGLPARYHFNNMTSRMNRMKAVTLATANPYQPPNMCRFNIQNRKNCQGNSTGRRASSCARLLRMVCPCNSK
jgi:hypothetical protein